MLCIFCIIAIFVERISRPRRPNSTQTSQAWKTSAKEKFCNNYARGLFLFFLRNYNQTSLLILTKRQTQTSSSLRWTCRNCIKFSSQKSIENVFVKLYIKFSQYFGHKYKARSFKVCNAQKKPEPAFRRKSISWNLTVHIRPVVHTHTHTHTRAQLA